jgi:hypothetical protein
VANNLKRDLLPDGSIELSADDCSFTYKRVKAGLLRVTVKGHDTGQFGSATLDEIVAAIARDRKIELFIDAREAIGAAVSVSDEWTRFFSHHRDGLTRVHVLVGSKVVYLTVAIAQHLSRTGNLLQIYSDPEIFESRLPAA